MKSIIKRGRGRQAKPFVFNGETIDGLRLRTDGRREVTLKTSQAYGKVFAESDPSKAVDRFRNLTATNYDPSAATLDGLPQPYAKLERDERALFAYFAEQLR